MKTGDFLGVPLTDTGIDGLIDWLTGEPTRQFRSAGYLNAHTFNMISADVASTAPAFRDLDLIYPDGMSVVWAARLRGFPVRERASAGDYFPRFCQKAAERGRRVALVGGPEGLAEACADALRRQVPGLQVVHTQDGFWVRTPQRCGELAARLKDCDADIVLLGMGTPQQEQGAAILRVAGFRGTVWCVGALFEYYTPGVRSHAPAWMRRSGLEWVYRLALEPRRLWSRYLIGNLLFLWRVVAGKRVPPPKPTSD